MSFGNARASILALKKESVSGTIEKPTVGADFVPLRPGFSISRDVEELQNEELRSGIAEVRSAQGKETVNVDYEAYLKPSGVEGQANELAVLWESALGDETVNDTEYDSQAGTDTEKIAVTDGTNFSVGQGLLIKDAANGFSIRNVKEIDDDDLILNFPLSNNPGADIDLGKAITYKPTSSDFPTFSIWEYIGNGHALAAASRNEVTDISVDFTANEYANISYTIEGQNYRFNPIEITSSNNKIDFNDGGAQSTSVSPKLYNNPHELASALQSAMDAESTDNITVSYNNNNGKFTIATDGSSLSLLWDSGANSAETIGAPLGFNVASDDTGATSYEADNAQSYESGISPVYDNADPFIAKDMEFYIGDADNMMCRCATSATIQITKETEDVDCICEETGTKGKVATQRVVTITAEIILDKHDVSLFKAMKDNDELQVMLNVGEKQGGNYRAGRSFNFYAPNAGVTEFTTAGENFIVANVSVKAFFNEDGQCFVNFL